VAPTATLLLRLIASFIHRAWGEKAKEVGNVEKKSLPASLFLQVQGFEEVEQFYGALTK